MRVDSVFAWIVGGRDGDRRSRRSCNALARRSACAVLSLQSCIFLCRKELLKADGVAACLAANSKHSAIDYH